MCVSCHMKFHNIESHTGWQKFQELRPENCAFVTLYKNMPVKVKETDLEETCILLKGLCE